jgi:hypothetical protein
MRNARRHSGCHTSRLLLLRQHRLQGAKRSERETFFHHPAASQETRCVNFGLEVL